jgi:hypothetical protein
MGMVSFTVRASLMPEHADGQEVSLEIDFQEAKRRRDVRKYPHRASAGQLETLYEGADTLWDLDLAPVFGDQFARVKEFLDSTARGQTFRVWIYGSEAAPVTVKRFDKGYSPQPFSRTGNTSKDHFTQRITVIEQ